jgi:hypothetical protein
MTEKEIFEVLYKRHRKMKINLAEACRNRDFGISYSKAVKYFGGAKKLPDSIILQKKILPKWEKNENGIKMWKLTEIAKWLTETEGSND